MALVFGIEISILASSPAAMEDMSCDASWMFSSRRPAPSAYSREVIETWLGGTTTVTRHFDCLDFRKCA